MLEEEEGVYAFCFCCHQRVYSEVSLEREEREEGGTYILGGAQRAISTDAVG